MGAELPPWLPWSPAVLTGRPENLEKVFLCWCCSCLLQGQVWSWQQRISVGLWRQILSEKGTNTMSFHHCLEVSVDTASSIGCTALSRVCMVTRVRGHNMLRCAVVCSVMGSPFFQGQSGLHPSSSQFWLLVVNFVYLISLLASRT